MAKQTSKKAAAQTPAADTQNDDAPESAEQIAPEGEGKQPDTAAAEQAAAVKPAETTRDERPTKLKADPDLADVAAFVGVPEDQVFAFKVHPDRAVIVTVAGQRVIREL